MLLFAPLLQGEARLRLGYASDLPQETVVAIRVWVEAERIPADLWAEHELASGSLDEALRRAHIDLAVGLAATTERRLVFHVTKPWRDHLAVAARFGHEPRAERLRAHLRPRDWIADFRLLATALAAVLAALILWRRMRRAEQLAEQALLVKSELLANLSHEFRTPLNGIHGMAQLLLESPLTRAQRDQVETIRLAAGDLTRTVGGLLEISSLRSGVRTGSRTNFDLIELLESVIWAMRPAAALKRLELGVRVDPQLPRHWNGDAARIRQILIHLVSNGIKFTSSGSVQVLAQEDSGGLEIRVIDTGIGIEASRLDEIFGAFAVTDSGTERKHRGLGLGLALSRGWAKQMGGSLLVQSQPGEGSAFSLRLPLSPSADLEPQPLAHVRALIIDDGSLAALTLIDYLTRLGARAATVGSLPVALSLVRDGALHAQPFRFVFLQETPAFDRETLRRSLRLTSSASPVLLPLTDYRLEELAVLLAEEPRPEPEAPCDVPLTPPTAQGATPYPKTDTRSALTA